jgi:hypothetical protein
MSSSSSNPDSDPDSNDSDSPSSDDLFRLDIVDGEDPSREVCKDRVRTNPPGPGPTPHTRFAILQDGSFAIIERAALGAWICADEVLNLEDTR